MWQLNKFYQRITVVTITKFRLLNNELVTVTTSQHSSNKMQNENCALFGYYAVHSGNYFYRSSGQPMGPIINSWPFQLGPTVCPEISVWNHHYSLQNNPQEHNSHLLGGGSLKSCKMHHIFILHYNTDTCSLIVIPCGSKHVSAFHLI